MEEIWKDIIGYEGLYQISNYGRVKSFKKSKEKILKNNVSKNGYYKVTLIKNKEATTKKNHQLVAIHFLNHKPCGMKLVVNHKDFNKLNNHVDNLEIVTARENTNLKHIKSSSKYVGVSWHKPLHKWRAQIEINKVKKHLGYFTNELDAHNAYQNKLRELTITDNLIIK